MAQVRRSLPRVAAPAALVLSGIVVFVAIACGDEEKPAGTTPSASQEAGPTTSEPVMPPDVDADVTVDAGATLSPTFVHRDINHVLGTGQSLSVGAVGTPPLSIKQFQANLMFSSGVIAGKANLTAFAPLVEGTVPGGSNPDVETMSASFSSLVTKMARAELLRDQPTEKKRSHDLLVSVHGVGGFAYAKLKKGTEPYSVGMAQAKAGFETAKSLGKSYVVRAVTNVHGESDHDAASTTYQADIAQWQKDYETDVKAITGQSDPIPMFHTQMSSWTKYGEATSTIPFDQLAEHVKSAGKTILVGPKYHLSYAADGVHLTNEGYRHMGEDYAKAYRRVILEGRPWEPLRPIALTRAGNIITVKLVVPAPPLVLDAGAITDPGSFGFEFAETGPAAPQKIVIVALASPDTVRITLAGAPTGTNKRLRYAFTGKAGNKAGPTTGPRGNLRDSDTTASRNGEPLYNWCVHFDEPVD